MIASWEQRLHLNLIRLLYIVRRTSYVNIHTVFNQGIDWIVAVEMIGCGNETKNRYGYWIKINDVCENLWRIERWEKNIATNGILNINSIFLNYYLFFPFKEFHIVAEATTSAFFDWRLVHFTFSSVSRSFFRIHLNPNWCAMYRQAFAFEQVSNESTEAHNGMQ